MLRHPSDAIAAGITATCIINLWTETHQHHKTSHSSINTISKEHQPTCAMCSSMAMPGIFILGAIAQGVWGTTPSGVQGRRLGTGSRGQNLKQFCLQIWLQKWPKSENFAQFTSWFLTSMFHGEGCKQHIWDSAHPSPWLAPALVLIYIEEESSWRTAIAQYSVSLRIVYDHYYCDHRYKWV